MSHYRPVVCRCQLSCRRPVTMAKSAYSLPVYCHHPSSNAHISLSIAMAAGERKTFSRNAMMAF